MEWDDVSDGELSFPKYVNVYEVTQGYGGPEEGGWWYNVGEPLESVRVDTQEELDAAWIKLHKRYDLNEDGQYIYKHDRDNANYDVYRARGASSAAGGYDVVISVQDHFAEVYPRDIPYYE